MYIKTIVDIINKITLGLVIQFGNTIMKVWNSSAPPKLAL